MRQKRKAGGGVVGLFRYIDSEEAFYLMVPVKDFLSVGETSDLL